MAERPATVDAAQPAHGRYRGFHHRGACVHARSLKQAVVAGGGVPGTYEAVVL
ncbi:MAG: hypothetical protein O2782_14765 [bacterium]|nr:hypothetical protein [bacterium]